MSDQVQELPANHKILKNGAVYDLDAGRIVANPGGGTAAITKDNARDYHERREVKRLQAQLEAQRSIREVSGAPTSMRAFGVMTGHLYKQVFSPDNKLREQVEAARFVGQATGLMVDQRQAAGTNGAAATLSITDNGLRVLAEVLAELANRRDEP